MPFTAPTSLGDGATGIGGTTSMSMTTTAAITVGDLVFVAINWPDDGNANRSNIATVTDSAGNIYALLVHKRHSTSGDRYLALAACFGATNAMAAGGTITASIGPVTTVASIKRMTACKVPGGTGSSLDKTATNEGASSPWSTSSTGTLADGNEISFGVALGRGFFSSGTPGNVPTNGYANVYNTYNSNIEFVIEYKILAGDTSAQNPGGTWDPAYTWWIAAAATFQASAIAPVSPIKMMV